MTKNIKEVKCPKCGGSNLIYSVFYQSIKSYKVLSNGKLSKKCTLQKDMPMEVQTLCCADCGEQIKYYNLDKEGNIEVKE